MKSARQHQIKIREATEQWIQDRQGLMANFFSVDGPLSSTIASLDQSNGDLQSEQQGLHNKFYEAECASRRPAQIAMQSSCGHEGPIGGCSS